MYSTPSGEQKLERRKRSKKLQRMRKVIGRRKRLRLERKQRK